MSTPTYTCEVCGRPAAVRVYDIQALPPVNNWARWAPLGPLHLYCDQHQRQAIRLDRQGQEIPPETTNEYVPEVNPSSPSPTH